MYFISAPLQSAGAAIECALTRAEVRYRFHPSAAESEPDFLADVIYRQQLPTAPVLIFPSGRTVLGAANICLQLQRDHPAANILPPPGIARQSALYGLIRLETRCFPGSQLLDLLAGELGSLRRHPQQVQLAALRTIWQREWQAVLAHLALQSEAPAALEWWVAAAARASGFGDDSGGSAPLLAQLDDLIAEDDRCAEIFERHWPEVYQAA